jgi:hypothetical protein
MKQTINQSSFIDAFMQSDSRKEQFSYEALCAMFEYIEDYEQDSGEELELDIIALCCEWSESEVKDVANDYNIDLLDSDDLDTLDDSEKTELVMDYLNDNSPYAVELSNGCILYVQF